MTEMIGPEMTCDTCRSWLNGYVDNELDTTTATAVARHLSTCAECRRAYQALKDLSAAVTQHAPYHVMPEGLASDIFAALRAEEARTRPVPVWRSRLRAVWQDVRRPWVAPAFSTVALAAALLLSVTVPQRLPPDTGIDEAVSSHVRSLMEHHLMDVASSDQHTVKPWFAGRIDFSPPVADFAKEGFPLLGGRLDYLQHQTVAALSYQHAKHLINVFIGKTAEADAAPKTLSENGYNIIVWRQKHLAFTAVSDLNAAELADLTRLISTADD